MTTFRFPADLPALPESAPPVWQDASLYRPRKELRTALDLAVNLQRPLLITGEPGCGKTTAAYWAGLALGHVTEAHGPRANGGPAEVGFYRFQVRSDVIAARATYEFDAVKYFRDSQVEATRASAAGRAPTDPNPRDYVREGALWRAFEATGPVVLLFDEVDKAPRDFPNDLLRELDRFEFDVPELATKEAMWTLRRRDTSSWLCVLTSNQERELPQAFLRRCLHHHIELSREDYDEILAFRRKKEKLELDDGLYKIAVERFWALREHQPPLRHQPSLGELLMWFKGLSTLGPGGLAEDPPLHQTPYLEALLKVPEDVDQIRGGKGTARAR